MDWLTDPNAWIGLLTLTVLEIVLGVDNIILSRFSPESSPRINERRRGTGFVRRILLSDSPASASRGSCA
jgi:hypothetical protein